MKRGQVPLAYPDGHGYSPGICLSYVETIKIGCANDY